MCPQADSDRQLILAAKAGDLAKVNAALDAGCDVNERDEHGHTALAMGVETPPIVEQLLARGADPNIPNNWRETPLDLACTVGNLHTVERLVSAGAQVNHRDAQGRTPLGEAISRAQLRERRSGKYWEIAEHLLRHGAFWSVADCRQATRAFAKSGSSLFLAYCTFLMKASKFSRDAEEALSLAMEESFPLDDERFGLLGYQRPDCELLFMYVEEAAEQPVVQVSGCRRTFRPKEWTARFRLIRADPSPGLSPSGRAELIEQGDPGTPDLDAALAAIESRFADLMRVWEWKRWWAAIEVDAGASKPDASPQSS